MKKLMPPDKMVYLYLHTTRTFGHYGTKLLQFSLFPAVLITIVPVILARRCMSFKRRSIFTNFLWLVGHPKWWLGKKGEKIKPKEACNESNSRPILGQTNEQYHLFIRHFASKSGMEGEWIIDSGCIEHITHLPDFLENKRFF
uniref:Uncharacterized protein n=1 Tax=Lactuca sativa TaxID=4236 RepID=A0A9R1XX30_LACSA|nr:hypothetical protein LSAT_V11C200066250 [Lactuca sativa]